MSVVYKSDNLGLPLVFQQTPHPIIDAPPSDFIIPPLVAEDPVMSVTVCVDKTGTVTD